MPIFRRINKNFFKKWTPDMAYVLGFFAADGYITVNKRGGQFWSIQIIDRDILYKIRKLIGSNHKIGQRKFTGNAHTLYRLEIGSIEMCNDLRSLGYGERKTKNLVLPSVPEKYLIDFVRGYFDGDGNVWVGQIHKTSPKPGLTIRVSFTSCSRHFLTDLRNKLAALGLRGGNLYNNLNYWRLTYSKGDTLKLYKMMYPCYPSKDIFLSRKRQVFEEFVKSAAVAQR